MRDSNTTLYIVAGIIIFHFLAGIIFLIYKMNNKPADKNEDKNL